ncbi:MAG: DNA repair protein RecO C-terminal domain-containing protein [Trueperaceae bacterium]|nr:DNA repair protein RecO C-terminal domain-containing protein [Trueperaceae bacterium]
MRRTQVRDALVLRRSPLPSGDVVATLLSPDGIWRAVVRKGRLPGGNLARLSLFHDVTVQYWRCGDDDLALVTQVRLNGALSGLTRPEAYPYAHLLAELAAALTADHPVGERWYALVASGLRGLNVHDDPEAVALAYAWRLIATAGLAPTVDGCARCGAPPDRLAVADGTARCAEHGDPHGSDAYVGEGGMRDLGRLVSGSLGDAVAAPPSDRPPQWRLLRRYVEWHVGTVRALEALLRPGAEGRAVAAPRPVPGTPADPAPPEPTPC